MITMQRRLLQATLGTGPSPIIGPISETRLFIILKLPESDISAYDCGQFGP